jgi:colicin import membrane protein
MRPRLCACALLLFGTPMALSYHAVDKPCPMGSSGPLAVQPADDGMDDPPAWTPAAAQRTGTEEVEAAARAEVKEAEEAKATEVKAAEVKTAEAKEAEAKAAEAKATEVKTAEAKAAEAKAKAARAKAAEAALAEADEAARQMAEEVNDDAMVPCPTDEPSVRKEVTAAETTRTLAQAAARNHARTAARASAPGYSEEAMNRMMR